MNLDVVRENWYLLRSENTEDKIFETTSLACFSTWYHTFFGTLDFCKHKLMFWRDLFY